MGGTEHATHVSEGRGALSENETHPRGTLGYSDFPGARAFTFLDHSKPTQAGVTGLGSIGTLLPNVPRLCVHTFITHVAGDTLIIDAPRYRRLMGRADEHGCALGTNTPLFAAF